MKDDASEVRTLTDDGSTIDLEMKLEKSLIDARYFHHEPHQQQFTKITKPRIDLKTDLKNS